MTRNGIWIGIFFVIFVIFLIRLSYTRRETWVAFLCVLILTSVNQSFLLRDVIQVDQYQIKFIHLF